MKTLTRKSDEYMIKRKTRSMIIPKWYKEALDKRAYEKHVAPKERIAELKKKKSKFKRGERKKIEMTPYYTHHLTFLRSSIRTTAGVIKALGLMKGKRGKIIVNNIGSGYNYAGWKGPTNELLKGTYEPFFIANELERRKRNYEIRAYSLNPMEIEKSKEQRMLGYGAETPPHPFEDFGKHRVVKGRSWTRIPKKILEKVKFNQLDIITETPAKQADITTIMGIPTVHSSLFEFSPEDMAMLKNAVDSTKSKGYVICKLESTKENEICKMFGLKKIDDHVYQKMSVKAPLALRS